MTKWMHFFQVSAARLDTTLKIFSWPVHTSQWLKMFTTKFGFFFDTGACSSDCPCLKLMILF